MGLPIFRGELLNFQGVTIFNTDVAANVFSRIESSISRSTTLDRFSIAVPRFWGGRVEQRNKKNGGSWLLVVLSYEIKISKDMSIFKLFVEYIYRHIYILYSSWLIMVDYTAVVHVMGTTMFNLLVLWNSFHPPKKALFKG